ncbi:MAG: type II secretion system protein [Phycisphaerales bacterium]
MLMRSRPARRGFTLIEILIVVVILAILAAIVVPRFAIPEEANAASLRTQLKTLRSQIELYRARNNGQAPPLVLSTDGDAAWAPLLTGDPIYLPTAPVNVFNGLAGVGDTESTDIGWVWDASNGGTLTAPYFDEVTGLYSRP